MSRWNLPIQGPSGTFRLGNISTMERGYENPTQPKMYFNGKPAIGIAVSMAQGGKILALGNNLNSTIARVKQDLPLGMEIGQVADQSKVVSDAVNEFVTTLLIAIFIVLLVRFLALGARSGLVVALSIPLVICGAMLTVMLIAPIFSWIVACTAIPVLGHSLVKVKPSTGQPKDIYGTKFYQAFRHILVWCLKNRVLVLILTVVAFTGSPFLAKEFKKEFFPAPYPHRSHRRPHSAIQRIHSGHRRHREQFRQDLQRRS